MSGVAATTAGGGQAVQPCTQDYQRRAGEESVLHQAVRDGLSARIEDSEAKGGLPGFLLGEVRRFLACGVLAHG